MEFTAGCLLVYFYDSFEIWLELNIRTELILKQRKVFFSCKKSHYFIFSSKILSVLQCYNFVLEFFFGYRTLKMNGK